MITNNVRRFKNISNTLINSYKFNNLKFTENFNKSKLITKEKENKKITFINDYEAENRKSNKYL